MREVGKPIDGSLLCAIGQIQDESGEHKKDIYAQEAVLRDNGQETIRIKFAGKRRRAGCKRNKQVKEDHHQDRESAKTVDRPDLLRATIGYDGISGL
jgi:hypothetical protein